MSNQQLNDSVNAKLASTEAIISMSPAEAELAGAFVEDAIDIDDAIGAIADQGAQK
jgi:hypothetical protein